MRPFGRLKLRRRSHDGRRALRRSANGPKIGARRGRRPGDDEPADEALARSELVARNLMAHRAGHAVVRQPVLVRRARSTGRCANTWPLRPFGARRRARHRHVADRALILDVRGSARVVDRFAADTRLPVRIARRVRHHRRAPVDADRHVLARRARSGCCGTACSCPPS